MDVRDSESIRYTKDIRDTKSVMSGTPKISRIPGIYGI